MTEQQKGIELAKSLAEENQAIGADENEEDDDGLVKNDDRYQ